MRARRGPAWRASTPARWRGLRLAPRPKLGLDAARRRAHSCRLLRVGRHSARPAALRLDSAAESERPSPLRSRRYGCRRHRSRSCANNCLAQSSPRPHRQTRHPPPPPPPLRSQSPPRSPRLPTVRQLPRPGLGGQPCWQPPRGQASSDQHPAEREQHPPVSHITQAARHRRGRLAVRAESQLRLRGQVREGGAEGVCVWGGGERKREREKKNKKKSGGCRRRAQPLQQSRQTRS
ncbi:hypothetical protein T492DRAFT_86718 [Pavlovales sp. CCMP2436]|nr:hypothetical protein T492DRAFT_86718 [Pavlovales sp. CCMP2436]